MINKEFWEIKSTARRGEHPRKGTYWYRSSPPIFEKPPYTRWSKIDNFSYIGNAAQRGQPPKARIISEIENYKKGKSKIVKGAPEDRYEEAVELVYSRYRLFNYK